MLGPLKGGSYENDLLEFRCDVGSRDIAGSLGEVFLRAAPAIRRAANKPGAANAMGGRIRAVHWGSCAQRGAAKEGSRSFGTDRSHGEIYGHALRAAHREADLDLEGHQQPRRMYADLHQLVLLRSAMGLRSNSTRCPRKEHATKSGGGSFAS